MTSLTPTTATDLHKRGHRAIACHTWLDGSYLKLSDQEPIKYTVHGAARGCKRPSIRDRDHVPGLRPYSEYFGRAVWVAVEERE